MMASGDSVPTNSVLECLTRLLLEKPKNVSEVLPVLLAERARWTPIISDAFQQDGALVVDSTVCGGGVPCGEITTDAPDLVPAVEALLAQYNADEPAAALQLRFEAGTAQVVGATDYDTANRGQRAVREIATAVCHEDLRSADRTVLIVAEDALDARHVAQTWALLMRLPELLSLRAGTRLTVFAGDSSAGPGTGHYAGDQSVRYVVDRRGLQVRRPWAQNRAAVSELGVHDQDDMPLLVLFLGAGASTSAGLPLGNTVRDRALEHLMQEPVSHDTADEVAGRFFDQLSELEELLPGEEDAGRGAFVSSLTLERVLAVEQAREGVTDCHTLRRFRAEHATVRSALATRAAAGGFADDPLLRLLGVQKRIVLVTVNFDQVVEAKGGALVRAFVTDTDFAELPQYLEAYAAGGGPIPLIKMHGDIDVPASIVANLEQTQAGLSLARSQALSHLVDRVSLQQVRRWWYVGYSMRDRDLDSVWTGGAFADRMTERWVAPTVDPHVRAFIGKQRLLRWSDAARKGYSADERTITTTAHDFFGLLFDEVASRW
jgi:hypothetical protein